MIAHLELLTIKAISYWWVSVRAFHKFIAKQVEQRRLDWQDLKAIQDQAMTFFRHSDLRNSRTWNESRRNSSASASGNHQQAVPPTVTKEFALVLARVTSKIQLFTESITDAAFAKVTILCYTAPNVVPRFLRNDKNSTSALPLWPFNTSAVVRHLLASRHSQPNAFGAKFLVPTALLLSNWKILLSNYQDKMVIDFLSYGWPINYRGE